MNRSLLERVNPVFHTARMALSGLAMAGDRDAAMIADRLGMGSDDGLKAEDPLIRLQNLANSVFLEIRYRTVGAIAGNSGCSTIVDLPCGYTPRGLQMMRQGRGYVGLDLPATIQDMDRVVMPLAKSENRTRIRYAAVDATNLESLESALEGVQGPICITTEGLLMYFNDFETASLCDNIRRLLVKHGGCWITSDPEMMVQNTFVMQAIAGDRYQEIMDNLMRGFENKADIHVEAPSMMILPWKNGGKDIESDTEKALSFLAERGLQAERLEVESHMPEMMGFSSLEPEVVQAVREGMRHCAYWRITPRAERSNGVTEETSGQRFSVKAAISDGILKMSLAGRVDTLTAPQVLELYERATRTDVISGVVIDCEKLEYISSAGLRVLLIMKKDHPVRMISVGRLVMEILETAGFDSIFEVCGEK